jgi:hypothetical protein
MDSRSTLGELTSSATVRFDLDGTGSDREWSWVRPGTAFLVWDPSHEGQIRSGAQLFGSVSFRKKWSDGYAALASLDRNGDGRLDGAELEPLAAWFDRNANARSEPGEVVRLDALGIVSISVEPTTQDGDALMNPLGLQLRDGRSLPTYDWISRTGARLAAR